MRFILNKPDTFGVFASALCMLHCIATPLLFIVNSCALGGCETAPIWWRSIDYVFLIISFIAIYHTIQTTTNRSIEPAFWISWGLLFIVIVNERLKWLPLPEYLIYIPAIALIALHIYNLNYCQCKSDKCCVDHE